MAEDFNTGNTDYFVGTSASVDPKIAEIKSAIAHIRNPGDIHIPNWNAYIEREMQGLVTSGKYTQAQIDLALATPDPKSPFAPIPEGGLNAGPAPINNLYTYRNDDLESLRVPRPGQPGFDEGFSPVGVITPEVDPEFGVAAPYREVDAGFGGVKKGLNNSLEYTFGPGGEEPAQGSNLLYEFGSEGERPQQTDVSPLAQTGSIYPADSNLEVVAAPAPINGPKTEVVTAPFNGFDNEVKAVPALADFGTPGDTKFANINLSGVNLAALNLQDDGRAYGGTDNSSPAFSNGISAEAGRTA